MKPKYRIRLVSVGIALLILLFLLLKGISWGISAIRIQLNTTPLEGITASNVLEKESMLAIQSVVKQDDASKLVVTDSKLVMLGNGKVLSLKMNFVNISGENISENWQLVSTESKTTLCKSESGGQKHLKTRNLPLSIYYPGLSRATTSAALKAGLEARAKAGDLGIYIFTDHFGNNKSPVFQDRLTGNVTAIWVSKTGDTTFELEPTYKPALDCVPTVVTVQAIDRERTTDKKTVLQEEKELFVVLFEAATYS